MPKITILPDTVVDRIAAGEIVERPASVVKEIIENSIDAGATRIFVDLLGGGMRMVRVSDNGEGMSREDALLSLKRHATSKLRTEEDLIAVSTLGFRGEALPSIAAVSKLRLVTTPRDTSPETASLGTEVVCEGGRVTRVAGYGSSPGTIVEVSHLFYNVPARRKFLKSIPIELGHISDMIHGEVLARPSLHFRLAHNGKVIFNYPPVSGYRDRIRQIYGEDLSVTLCEIEFSPPSLHLIGCVSIPPSGEEKRTLQEIIVNRRWVKSQTCVHAVYEAYEGFRAKDTHPVFFLSLELDPASIDVNVHPTKREVRFRDQRMIHDLLTQAIRERLGEVTQSRYEPSVFSSSFSFPPPIRPLGQIHDTFLVAQVGEELVIVDQHAAHERVLYERLISSIKRDAQPLLLPVSVELTIPEALTLKGYLKELDALHFEIEGFGQASFLIRSVPPFLARANIAAVLTDLIKDLSPDESTRFPQGHPLQERIKKAAASLACHAAIKARQTLQAEEITALIQDLLATEASVTCPHGRPTIVRFSMGDLEKAFQRR